MIKELFDINSQISHGMFLVNVIGMDNYLSEDIIGLNNETDLLGVKTAARPCPGKYDKIIQIYKFDSPFRSNPAYAQPLLDALNEITSFAYKFPNSPAAQMLDFLISQPNLIINFKSYNSMLPTSPNALTTPIPSTLFSDSPQFNININMYDFGPHISKSSSVVEHLNMLPIPYHAPIVLTATAIVFHELAHVWEVLNFKPPNTALAAVQSNYISDLSTPGSTVFDASETRAQKWEALYLRDLYDLYMDFTDPSFFYLNNPFPISLMLTRSVFEPFTTYVP